MIKEMIEKELKIARVRGSELNALLADDPQFVMSKYLTIEDLLRDKAKYYEDKYIKLLTALADDYNWLLDNITEMNENKNSYAKEDHDGLPYSVTMFDSVINEAQLFEK